MDLCFCYDGALLVLNKDKGDELKGRNTILRQAQDDDGERGRSHNSVILEDRRGK